MTLFYLLGGFLVIIGALTLGYKAGRLSIADECLTKGFFFVSHFEFNCTQVFKRDQAEYGLPDVLRDEQDNGAFAEGTLTKLKLLTAKTRHNLKHKQDQHPTPEAPPKPVGRKSFFGEAKHYDCAQCCRDASDIPRIMILCPLCGNKRCPKAANHRFKCSRSNTVGQVGVLDEDAPQQRIDGSFLFDAVRPDQDVFNDTYSK